ncbi:Alpha/Beta hydrolase protein [Mrakia frigida]|uniref:steryl deacetylase n=1 Tax=Mrakia frigida TaxID=29902 RepID=UPI003FCBFD5E
MVLPHALLQPPIFPLPFLAPFFPPTGPLAWSIRFARLLYTFLFSFPLLFLSSLTTSFFDFSLLPTFPGRDSRTSAFVPFIASLIWCATWGFLDPPSELPHGSDEVGNKAREEGPRLSLWLFGKKGVKVKGVEIQEAEEEWCRGVVKDGFGGKVRRRRVGGSWVWRENDGREIEGDGKAKEGEKVVMYCVGGGYVSGDALLGPFIFNLLHSSLKNHRFFALSYRLAQHPSTAFPACLQDVLASWIYLTKEKGFRPENVILAGDSAGGGAIWSLVSYLGVLSEEEGGGLGMPGKVALFSPWSDLTLSHPSIISNAPFDILNRGQCVTAAAFYTRNLDSPAPSPPSSARKSTEDITNAAQLLERESFDRFGAAHPIFSPSALAHHQHVHVQAREEELVDASKKIEIGSAATPHDHPTLHPDPSPSSTSSPATSSPSEYHSIISNLSSGKSSSHYLSPSSTPSSSGSSTPSPSLRKHSPTHPTSSKPKPTSHILSLLLASIAKSHTRFFVHSGSAELFASEIDLLVASLRAANIPVWSIVEEGLCHGGAQSFPMAKDGKGEGWSGKAARKAGRAFGCFTEGGGGRDGGGEGWVWGD